MNFQASEQILTNADIKVSTASSKAAQTDYERIIDALRLTYFDKKKASKLIGMDTHTMNQKIKAYADERGFEMIF